MSDEKILKGISIYSFFLMMFVILFSIGLHSSIDEVSYAQEPLSSIEGVFLAISSTPTLTPVAASPTPVIMPWTIWDDINGVKESEVFSKLSEQVIIIEKLSGINDNAQVQIEDLSVDRQIRLTISGLISTESVIGNIYRVMEETLFDNEVPTPSPTPTPTPKPKDLTPSPTSIIANTSGTGHDIAAEEHEADETIYETVIDPVNSYTLDYKEVKENGTYTAVLVLNLGRTYLYELLEDESYYYVCLKRPKDVYSKIVVIDAGHGGQDSGTYSSGYTYLEKDMNLKMLLYLKEFLEKEEDIKVYCTRTTDRRLTLNQRVNLANDLEADFFISIHCNSNPSSKIGGTEVLYNDKQNDWTCMNSKRFSLICQEETVKSIGLKNRGIVPRSHNVHIIREAKMPVALIEVAFMTNKEDLSVLIKDKTHKAFAEGIYCAVLRAYEEMESD